MVAGYFADPKIPKKRNPRTKEVLFLVLFLGAFLALPTPSWAGVTLKTDEDISIELGFRMQTQFLSSTNSNADSSGDHEEKFTIRRASVRLGGNVTKWVKFFLQVGNNDEPGTDNEPTDVNLIDSYINLHLHDLAQIMMGELMVPSSRQHLTSSAALMAIDHPGITGYSLTWGLNGGAVFNTTAFEDGNLDLEGDANLRDIGGTFFGSFSLNEMVHAKYYVGAYNGIQFMNDDDDKERVAARLQINFLDPEPNYYNLSTYLGQKKTIGIGVSIDSQQRIARDLIDDDNVNYIFYSFDAFADLPVGPGSATIEAGYSNLNLDNSRALRDSASGPPKNGQETEGQGFYVQSGYFINNLHLQPWAFYESWYSDASDDVGSWSAWRVGLSYFIKGHNANIKVGFEQFRSAQDIGGAADKNIESFLIGFYVSY
ncbi:MAG: OprO/OprP family phosphate-selective porin [Deltaproteobacteria bacterium]|nr:OprO/OprP family phosphate-selective porin [Deltaproteobacteria bacterium]